ncbi:hypothetical protein [Nostoc sp.]|uniref:hypothetical protein n=1 Tax=Nostoc sp. TaxID=1180 RepID=UPI002FF660F8
MKTLFLAWQDPKIRAWFPIGRLTYDGTKYYFVYTHGATEAQVKYGFQLLLSFPDLNKVYTSVELFPLFYNRLMQRSRPDYKNYIQSLNIPEGEDYPVTILSRSGGRKVTDNFEVFPCPEPDENGLSRWALKNTTRLRNVNCLKAYIQSFSGALHKFT